MTNRNGYGCQALDKFLSSLDWNNRSRLTVDYIERRLREHPTETFTFELPDEKHLVVRRDSIVNSATYSEDILGESISERYKWMFLEEQSELYGRELGKLVAMKTERQLTEEQYNSLLRELNERNQESRAPAMNKERQLVD